MSSVHYILTRDLYLDALHDPLGHCLNKVVHWTAQTESSRSRPPLSVPSTPLSLDLTATKVDSHINPKIARYIYAHINLNVQAQLTDCHLTLLKRAECRHYPPPPTTCACCSSTPAAASSPQPPGLISAGIPIADKSESYFSVVLDAFDAPVAPGPALAVVRIPAAPLSVQDAGSIVHRFLPPNPLESHSSPDSPPDIP